MFISGKRAFKANWDAPAMKLLDNLRTTIHSNEFELIIEQFCRSGSFFVEIKVENDANAGVITSAVSVIVLVNENIFLVLRIE